MTLEDIKNAICNLFNFSIVEERDDKIIYRLYDDKTACLYKSKVEEIIEELKLIDIGDSIELYDSNSYEVFVSSERGYYRDEISNFDNVNKIEYAIKEPSDRYLIFFLYNMFLQGIPRILRNGIGNAYFLMNSKHIGADIVYAWPTATISLMDKTSSINVLQIDSSKFDDISNPYAVAGNGFVDTVILPSNTRKRIISAIEMLLTKRVVKPAKKHSSNDY